MVARERHNQRDTLPLLTQKKINDKGGGFINVHTMMDKGFEVDEMQQKMWMDFAKTLLGCFFLIVLVVNVVELPFFLLLLLLLSRTSSTATDRKKKMFSC